MAVIELSLELSAFQPVYVAQLRCSDPAARLWWTWVDGVWIGSMVDHSMLRLPVSAGRPR